MPRSLKKQDGYSEIVKVGNYCDSISLRLWYDFSDNLESQVFISLFETARLSDIFVVQHLND